MSRMFEPIEREHDSETADRIRAHLDATVPEWRYHDNTHHAVRLLIAIVDEQRLRIEALETKLAEPRPVAPTAYAQPSAPTPLSYWR